jgi:integrase/recombinase XerD
VVLAQRVLSIPSKRGSDHLLGYLTVGESRAILARPNRRTSNGRRDYFVLALLSDAGARVQVMLDLRLADLVLDRPPLVRINSRGRRKRIVPLLPATATLVHRHPIETGATPTALSPLLLNQQGRVSPARV